MCNVAKVFLEMYIAVRKASRRNVILYDSMKKLILALCSDTVLAVPIACADLE